MIITKPKLNSKKIYETSIQFNDVNFKKLTLKYSKIAQNPRDFGFLPVLKTYEMYHEPLKQFFIETYGKNPTQCDNLAFMLLLTYTEEKINQIRSPYDIKISFNDDDDPDNSDSDFVSAGFHISQQKPKWENTCVCNERILYVHRFRNKYSNITINIGSSCNELYGLINKDDPKYKSNCKKIKEHAEHEKEKAEGKPEGFYENEKAMKKLEKEEEKLRKEREKEMKKMEKDINRLNKTYGTNVCVSRKCVLCEKCIIYNKLNFDIQICSNCSKNEQKKDKINTNKQIKIIKLEECLNCDKKGYNIKNELCKECHKICKLNNCEMCPERFISELISDDLYCPPCEENIIKCIDCKIVDVLQNKNMRCYKCDYKFICKITTKNCIHCDYEFDVNEENKWRIYCNACCKKNYHKKNIIKKCECCDDDFDVDEKYKNNRFCKPCYYKNKTKY